MEVISRLFDARINAWNVLAEMSVLEYADLVRERTTKNEFQRRRVSSSTTVYSLLKRDLLTGCVIPPLVLGITAEVDADGTEARLTEDLILSNRDNLVILDGLQRTLTIMDLLTEKDLLNANELDRFGESKLRVEVYIGLNRLGILYRMLTLNTGQTPMSLRQQIEMLYSDYQVPSTSNIELVREAEGTRISRPNQFVFKDVIEGFNAYLNRDESPIDRPAILDNISTLERLSREQNSPATFDDYLAVIESLLKGGATAIGEAQLPTDWQENTATPFGRNIEEIFKKAQVMSGLGAAIGVLIDRGVLGELRHAATLVSEIGSSSPAEFLESLNMSMDWIRNNSSKIGNAQRTFFKFFFRDLLNSESDSYLDLNACAKSALRKYQDQIA